MPAGGEAIIDGQYTVTWNGLAMGIMEGEEGVPTIEQILLSTPVNRTDKYGKTKIDSIHMGKDYTCAFLCMEYTKAIGCFDPFGAAFGQLGQIGALKYALSEPLVLTVVAGTPAVGSPNTVTAGKAIIADEHRGKLKFGPAIRTVPILLDLLPYVLQGSTVGAFVLA